MHAKTKSQSPRSKPTMPLFPSILHPSTYSTLLGDHQKTTPPLPTKGHETEHQHAYHVDHHQMAAFLIGFLDRMFAPAAYQQCTSSMPCWAVSHHSECSSKSRDETVIIVDDEFVLLEDRDSEEQDGGPICREATIESWKAPKKERKRYEDARRWSDLPYFGCP